MRKRWFEVKDLRNNGACERTIDQFTKLFGCDKVRVTKKNARKAYFMPIDTYGYEFLARGSKAQAEFMRKKRAIVGKYERAIDRSRDALDEDAFPKKCMKLRAKMHRRIAVVWARCYNKYGPRK